MRRCQRRGNKEGAGTRRRQEVKGRRDREIDIDFDLDFLLFKSFSGTSTPTCSEEMFAPSLVNEANKPSRRRKKAFQPQVSPSENMENNSCIPLLLSLKKKAIHSVSFYFLYNCYFFLSSAVAHFLSV